MTLKGILSTAGVVILVYGLGSLILSSIDTIGMGNALLTIASMFTWFLIQRRRFADLRPEEFKERVGMVKVSETALKAPLILFGVLFALYMAALLLSRFGI